MSEFLKGVLACTLAWNGLILFFAFPILLYYRHSPPLEPEPYTTNWREKPWTVGYFLRTTVAPWKAAYRWMLPSDDMVTGQIVAMTVHALLFSTAILLVLIASRSEFRSSIKLEEPAPPQESNKTITFDPTVKSSANSSPYSSPLNRRKSSVSKSLKLLSPIELYEKSRAIVYKYLHQPFRITAVTILCIVATLNAFMAIGSWTGYLVSIYANYLPLFPSNTSSSESGSAGYYVWRELPVDAVFACQSGLFYVLLSGWSYEVYLPKKKRRDTEDLVITAETMLREDDLELQGVQMQPISSTVRPDPHGKDPMYTY